MIDIRDVNDFNFFEIFHFFYSHLLNFLISLSPLIIKMILTSMREKKLPIFHPFFILLIDVVKQGKKDLT